MLRYIFWNEDPITIQRWLYYVLLIIRKVWSSKKHSVRWKVITFHSWYPECIYWFFYVSSGTRLVNKNAKYIYKMIPLSHFMLFPMHFYVKKIGQTFVKTNETTRFANIKAFSFVGRMVLSFEFCTCR